MTSITAKERAKYESIWSYPAYGDNSFGLSHVGRFLAIAKPAAGSTLIDVGAGNGVAAAELKQSGLHVTAFDLTDKAWNQPGISLINGVLWNDLTGLYDYAFCCDVMEHIPESFTALCIRRVLDASRVGAFFSVSFIPDSYGPMIGETLHLTVRPFRWWRDLFRELGCLRDARDMIGSGIFYLSGAVQ